MRANRPKDSSPEIMLRRELWKLGIRYRLHVKDLPGKPDIVISKHKIVVFVDGDFWHGKDWPTRKASLARGSNSDYWIRKIQYNIDRDTSVNTELESMGWAAMRVWESDIRKNVEMEATRIAERIDNARHIQNE